MKLEKSPPELEQTFDAVFPDDPRAQRKKMFGYAAGFVNGNMFGGLFENHMVLRLGDADRQVLTARHGAQPFMPMGRPMSGYVTVPPAILERPADLREWVNRAFEYGASLPPKVAKPKTAKAKAAKAAAGPKPKR